MYLRDIFAGIVIVLSLIFIMLSIAGYRRYRVPALRINILVFAIMLVDAVIYTLNTLYNLGVDTVLVFLISDSAILVGMYLALSMKG